MLATSWSYCLKIFIYLFIYLFLKIFSSHPLVFLSIASNLTAYFSSAHLFIARNGRYLIPSLNPFSLLANPYLSLFFPFPLFPFSLSFSLSLSLSLSLSQSQSQSQSLSLLSFTSRMRWPSFLISLWAVLLPLS